jgi:DNA modification methylase
VIETAGAAVGAPRNLLVRGDNLLAMDALLERFAGAIDLVYIDPPFWTGADFAFDAPIGGGDASLSRGRSGLAYGDGGSLGDYLATMRDRLERIRELLSETGTIFVHVDWHVGHLVRCLLDEVFGADAFKNEIVWRYRRWPAKTRVFQRMHDVIFWYGKRPGDAHAWTPAFEDLAPSTLSTWGTKRQVADFSSGRRRPSQTEHESPGAPLSDVWDIGIIAPIARERLGYPTQKPEALLRRILEAATRPGDLVADFFCGSGTTLAVAEKLGRRWIGCDLGTHAIQTTRKRLLELCAAADPASPSSFAVAELGPPPEGDGRGSARASAKLVNEPGGMARVRLTGFTPPADADVPREIRPHLGKWTDWIDGWAIDWTRDAGAFHVSWSAQRMGRRRALGLESPPFPHAEGAPVRLKLVDVLGHETVVSLR